MTASQFILVYDNERKSLERHDQFRDPAAAEEAYRDTERAYRDRPEVHVVMLSGQSLQTLAATHGTYFKEPLEFIKDLDARPDGAPVD
jgi:hypothetical protein